MTTPRKTNPEKRLVTFGVFKTTHERIKKQLRPGQKLATLLSDVLENSTASEIEILATPRDKDQKGFTLIEMIVVILLIGILTVAAMAKFWNLGGNAQSAVEIGNVRSMQERLTTLIGKNAGVTSPPNPTLAAMTGYQAAGVTYSNVVIYAGAAYNNWAPAFGWSTVLGVLTNSHLPATFTTCDASLYPATSAFWAETALAHPAQFPFSWDTLYSNFSTATSPYGPSFNGSVVATVFTFGGPYNAAPICRVKGFGNVTGGPWVMYLGTNAPASQGTLPLSSDFSGICVATGRKLQTYKDSAGTVATGASTDLVYSISDSSVADATHC